MSQNQFQFSYAAQSPHPKGLLGISAVQYAIECEEELPGQMPDEMWLAIRDDRDACAEAMRIAVRQTKANILRRVNELDSPNRIKPSHSEWW